MSYAFDDTYSVYETTRRKARVEHRCSACREAISVGHFYFHIAIVCRGTAKTVKRCLRCQMMHLHLVELCEPGETWPDERLNCGLSYESEWSEPPPPEIAALAFLTPDEAQEKLGKPDAHL